MKRYLFQLGIALTLSASILFGTLYWYHKVSHSSKYGKEIDIVADVNQITNEVERKPVNSLIWKNIDQSDIIYDGEAIRTLPGSYVKIYFRENQSYLDLEPESLIVIKKSKGEISLDLMEGSILVAKESESPTGDLANNKTTSTPKASLILNSKKGKIDLSQATVSLSKSSGDINLQVIKGQALIKDDKGQEKQLEQGTTGTLSDKEAFQEKKFTIISPNLSKTYYTVSQNELTIPFKWNGFGTNSFVELWIGPSPKNLKKYKITQNKNSIGEISVGLSPGKHFWKLVAKKTENETNRKLFIGESPINKTLVEMRYPPLVTGPLDHSKWVTEIFPMNVKYSAKEQSPIDKVNLIISTDPKFEKDNSTYILDTNKDLQVSIDKKGIYYWKFLTYFPETQEPLSSSTFEFNAVLKAEDINPIKLTWDLTEKEAVQYFVNEPLLNLKWKPTAPSSDVKFWRVKYKSLDNQAQEITTELNPQQLSSQSKLTKPGRYIASIEGVDSENRVLGSTPEKEIGVQELPLLPAPNFISQEDTIKSKPNGEAEIRWSPVVGAKEYWIQILKNGTELKKQNYKKTETTIRKLKPGEYEVQVYAVDEFNRKSAGTDKRKLVVPEFNDLKAPKLLKMSIKK